MTSPSLKVITLTERAARRIRDLRHNAGNPNAGLRIGVKNGGCAGMSYTMAYVDEPERFDEVVEDCGETVFIEAKAVLFLLGTQMDYQESELSSGFVFNNPNETSACGCGESIAITPASADAYPVHTE